MRPFAAAIAMLVALVGPVSAHAAAPNVTASIDKNSVSLGDPFHYTVEARVATDAPVRLTADLGPFSAVAPPRIERTREHGVSTVRLDQIVVCLDRGCAPDANARQVKLPRPTARWPGGFATARATEVTVVPRVPASAVKAARAVYRTDTGGPRRPRLGLDAVLFGTGALLLLAGALALGAWVARHGRRVAVRAARTLSFEEAARLLRESQLRATPDRRRAVDFAGRASARRGDGATASDAARLAWSRPDPDPAEIGALAEQLERSRGVE